MTSSDGTVSDGCGNTTTKYKSACTGNKTCNGSGKCIENCTPKSCSSVSVPSNASCDSYCTPQYSDCSTGSSVCTSWSCNSGYHQSGNSCVKDDDTICYDICYADCEDAFDNCISDWRYRNLHHMTIDDCYDEEQDCRDYCDDTYDQRNAGCTKVIILEDEKD